MRRITVTVAALLAVMLAAPDLSFARGGGGGKGGGGHASFSGHRMGGGHKAFGSHRMGGHAMQHKPIRYVALASQLHGGQARAHFGYGHNQRGHRPAAPHHAPVGHAMRITHKSRQHIAFTDHDRRIRMAPHMAQHKAHRVARHAIRHVVRHAAHHHGRMIAKGHVDGRRFVMHRHAGHKLAGKRIVHRRLANGQIVQQIINVSGGDSGSISFGGGYVSSLFDDGDDGYGYDSGAAYAYATADDEDDDTGYAYRIRKATTSAKVVYSNGHHRAHHGHTRAAGYTGGGHAVHAGRNVVYTSSGRGGGYHGYAYDGGNWCRC